MDTAQSTIVGSLPASSGRSRDALISISRTVSCCDWEGKFDLIEYRLSKEVNLSRAALASETRKVSSIRQAVKANTSEQWVRVSSLCRKYLSRPDWAASACNEALMANPRNHAAFASRIAADREMGNFERTERDYKKALAIAPSNSYAMYAIARARLSRGDFQGAVSPARNAFALRPSRPGGLLLASIAAASGDYELAASWKERAQGFSSKTYGNLYEDRGKTNYMSATRCGTLGDAAKG